MRPRPGPGWPEKKPFLKRENLKREATRTSLGSLKPLREALLLLLLLLQECQAERLERVNFKVGSQCIIHVDASLFFHYSCPCLSLYQSIDVQTSLFPAFLSTPPCIPLSVSSMLRGRWSTNAGPRWAMETPPTPWPGLGPSNVRAPPGISFDPTPKI